MGIIKQGVLGGFSGKVGNVVGASWKGIDYMRIMPESVANPNTVLQQGQRQKFSMILRFLQPLTQFLRTGFRNYAIRMSAFNNAMSYNMAHAVSGVYPDYLLNYEDALVARGSLAPALNPAITAGAASVNFTWEDNSGVSGASGLDKSLVVVYNPTKQEAVCVKELKNRSDLAQSVAVPAAFAGDTVQCYLAFISDDGAQISNSRFAGVATIL